jgi:tRNA pseudouridine38-40 synthase
VARLKLTLAYEGTRYSGWQLQSGAGGRCPTIQGEVEKAIALLLGRRYPVSGAGRTDAGVHAEAQVCHVDLPDNSTRIQWRKALNAKLPDDIRILEAAWAPPEFHARNDARLKRYAYSLWMDKERPLPRVRSFVWNVPALDVDSMRAAFPMLAGSRDFAAFQNRGTPVRQTVRTLTTISWQPGMVAAMRCPEDWPVATVTFEGDGFLKQMARNLVGMLVWIGLGKLPLESLPALVSSGDRRILPSPSAPARGLTLMGVDYADAGPPAG